MKNDHMKMFLIEIKKFQNTIRKKTRKPLPDDQLAEI
jgi:hypothetical protein